LTVLKNTVKNLCMQKVQMSCLVCYRKKYE
jgi:hypothetical protein